MLRLYNTLRRKIEEFKPLHPPQVGIYTCGPTVYREVHIGNFRTYILADLLRRVLLADGYKVTHIENITDVGHMRVLGHGHHQEQVDPIIEEALLEGKTPQQIAQHFTDLFLEDEKKLNILPATVYPKATEHIEEMIRLIEKLLAKGFAYNTDGTIYFDVKRFANYGQLSGNTLDKMDRLLKAVRVSLETDKKDSADFALWKKATDGRLMAWDSPWGRGFPGWHIECSAMSMKYLGETLDIHTGGEDLVFPHHEDEIAQSEAATGKMFVKHWVHGGYLLVDEEKMSRSKGNVYTIKDLKEKGFDPLSFRYLTFTVAYSARMNFTWEALEGAQRALEHLQELVAQWGEPKIGCAEVEERFFAAVHNDLNMPQALAIVWELVKSNNPESAKLQSLLRFDEILGLNLKEELGIRNKESVIPEEVMKLVKEREELRRNKRFHLADQMRNKIKKMGYIIQDTDDGETKLTSVRKSKNE